MEVRRPRPWGRTCCYNFLYGFKGAPSARQAKTAQKHDYPSKAHRRSYARRTGAERGFATAEDPATNDITRDWCRLMGLAPLMLLTAQHC